MSEAAGLITRLAARLDQIATEHRTINYGALAAELAVPGPGSIACLTAALESLMETDAALGRPLRAALLTQRGGTLPAPGFFDRAAALGFDTADPAAFVAEHRRRLFEPN